MLATVTVAFHPDLAILRRQQEQLEGTALQIIVDNGSSVDELNEIRALCKQTGTHLIENAGNRGLATACNQGATHARKMGARYLLFLDQDTEPGRSGAEALLNAYIRLRTNGAAEGCIGPRMVDAATGLHHGFHRIRGCFWVRFYPTTHAQEPIRCSGLNGSGTLIPMTILSQLGGFEDDFFMDQIDTEWSFRVLANGFSLYGAPGIVFTHRMGEGSWRFWLFGWRVWPYRSPSRHRYLFRNAMRLIRRNYVPRVWKAWVIPKLLLTMVVHGIFDSQRRDQLSNMLRGLFEGWRDYQKQAMESSIERPDKSCQNKP